MNLIDIFDDSPNGYELTSIAPTHKGIEACIRYYLDQLEIFEPKRNPEECGVLHFALGKLLFADKSLKPDSEERAKRVENALYYFNCAQEIFLVKDYPIMYALISVFMGKLFRERSLLISHRNFLSERSTPEESLQYGVDQVLEAIPIFMNSRTHQVEYAVCCAELGYLHLMQTELPKYAEDNYLREQALAYLDRAIGLSEGLPPVIQTMIARGHPVKWQPNDITMFPHHVRLLLDGQPFSHLEGISYYLMGRLEQGWGTFGVDENEHNHVISTTPNEHLVQAYEYFCKCVSPKYLKYGSLNWSDAHHRIALLIIRYPVLVDPDFGSAESSSDIYLDSTISHLSLALRSKEVSKHERMDQHFHLAQTYISKLQLVIDKVPFGESVTKAIIAADGVDFIINIEENLKEALKRVTAANTQSVQDAYLFYYASLKLAEYRMLEAACTPNMATTDREEHLKDSVHFIVDACVSRPLSDNVDMHYIASSQLAQVMMAVKRTRAASKAYGKLLFILSVLANRWLFSVKYVEKKIRDDSAKHATSAIYAATKDTQWIKLHIGPSKLHEKVAAGYACWSFEDIPRKKSNSDTEPKMANMSPYSKSSPPPGTGDMSTFGKITKPALPKGIPPLNLTQAKFKKVYVAGEEIQDPDAITLTENDGGSVGTGGSAFKPPAGSVPLSALGQTLHEEAVDDNSYIGDLGRNESSADLLSTPYTGRMRSKVPPVKEMKEIDKANRIAFGLAKGKMAYLLPSSNIESGHINTIDRKTKNVDSPAKMGTDKRKVSETRKFGNRSNYSNSSNKIGNLNEIDAKAVEEINDGDDEEEEYDDDDDDGGEKGSSDEDAGKSKNSTSTNNIITRPRSIKLRRPPLLEGANEADGNIEEKSDDSMSDDEVTQKNKKATGGLMNWMFGKAKPKEEKEGLTKKPSLLKSVFNQFKKTKGKEDKIVKKIENLVDQIGFWSSKQAFYSFMVLSRQSRIDLVTKSKRLKVVDGERACAILYKVKPKYLMLFSRARERLFKLCRELMAPVSNLKEMSALSMMELQILFRANTKVLNRLDEFEHMMYFKMSKADYFLPMVSNVPIFMRDVASYDDALLNAEVLMANMTYERALPIMHDHEQTKKQQAIDAAMVAKNLQHDEEIKKRRRMHDSVDSGATSYVSVTSKAVSEVEVGKTKEELEQEQEEKEEIRAGMMTYALSQELDGSGYYWNSSQGAKDLFIKYLGVDECMLIWHLPTIPNQNICCVLVWRENSDSLHEHFSSKQAVDARLEEEKEAKENKKNKKNGSAPGKKTTGEKGKDSKDGDSRKPKDVGDVKGVVMEFAMTDLPTTHLLQFMQRYLDALHSPSAPKKLTLSNDALRSLSCALSITELLLMIPPFVRSLVICCPPVMRMIPWHALLFETSKHKAPVMGLSATGGAHEDVFEAHLVEKFCIRLGPTLSIWELTCIAGSTLRQSVGLHRMCCIDGDDRVSKVMDGDKSSTIKTTASKSKVSAAGIRGADLEVACMASTWSADPEDYHILADHAATPSRLETCSFADHNLDKYRTFKEGVRIVNHHAIHPEGEETALELDEREKKRKELRQLHNEKYRERMKNAGKTGSDGSDNDSSNDSSDDDGDDENKKAERDKRRQQKMKTKEEKAFNKAMKQQRQEHLRHVLALTMCRVLHISANKIALTEDMADPETGWIEASIQLPESYEVLDKKSARSKQFDQGIFTASDIIHQIYLKNCALCILSRFGLTDDVPTSKSPIIDGNWEFIEAVHLAGACTVIVPLWEAGGQGLGTLACLVFLIRFYSMLPSKSRDRISVNETVRKTQLWMKDVNANDVIAFIHKAPIPKKARDLIIDEMESYVTASLTTAPLNGQEVRAAEDGNRKGGSRKFFTHFLHWGAFIVSGFGGNVHHPNLTEDAEDEDAAIFGDGDGGIDEELNNIEFEASVLRMEGKIEEAMELEKRIRELKLQKLKKRMQAVKETGFKAGRGFMDLLDYLDKNLLDQDSDEISVSDEEDKDDEEDNLLGNDNIDISLSNKNLDGNPSNDDGQSVATGTPNSRKMQFRPLDMDYGKWKGRVTGLNMNVPLPTLPTPDKKKEKMVALRNKMYSPSPKKSDNYEFNMMKKVNTKSIVEEEEEPKEEEVDDDGDMNDKDIEGVEEDESDASDEDDYEGLDAREIRRLKRWKAEEKERKKNQKALKAIRGGVRSYTEIAMMLADRMQEKANELPLDKIKNDINDKVKDLKVDKDKCVIC